MTNDPRRGLPSASSLERLHNCPGSWLASKDMPDESNDVAESGTRIHRALETKSMAGLSADEEQTAQMCDDQAWNVIADWSPNMTGTPHNEIRLGLTQIGGVVVVTDDTKADLVFTGQADLIIIDGKRGLVLDYKTGRGEVASAEENLQLRGLAVMAAWVWRLDSVRVAIVQPWAGPASVADYDENALTASRLWLFDLVKNVTKEDQDTLSPGNWCKYCKAKAACPALRKAVINALDVVHPETLPSTPEVRSKAVFARMMKMTPEQLIHIEKHVVGLMGLFVEAHKAVFRKRVEAGEIPGYRMKPGQMREKINDVSKVWSKCEALGVKAHVFTGACSVTKDALKTLLRDATGAKGKALESTIKDVLHGATESKETAQTIEEVKA